MGNLRYSIENESTTSNTQQLLYVSSSTYEKDWKSLPHSHSFTELIYIVDGEGDFWNGTQKFSIKKDDFIIINPHMTHTETSSSQHRLSYIVIGMDNISMDSSADSPLHDFGIYDFTPHRSLLLPLFQSLLYEMRQKNTSYQEICHHYASIITLLLTRITGQQFSLFSAQNIPKECERVKYYMNAHYQDTLTLNSLADLVHWDKFYLSHMFTKSYGISPINYLLERRILHSKELLKSTDYSITQIAHSTGFSSQNYFSQSFKKNTGRTPKEYREAKRQA